MRTYKKAEMGSNIDEDGPSVCLKPQINDDEPS